MKVYLAGPIFQCKDTECIDWRQKAKKLLNGIDVLDPMDRDYRGATTENYEIIVEEDKASIDTADVLLINHIKASVGTSMEVLYAWERDKHIVIINPYGEISPWLIYHSHKICGSIDDAVAYIHSLPRL